MHALIIEDESLLAEMIEHVLRDRGVLTVDIADTYTAAIAAAAMRPPRLITADVQLAEGCGIDAVQAITSLIAPAVLFVTGSGDEVRLRLPEAAVVDKPFSAATLGLAVARALE
ncbi:response regulator [Sphingomonas sp.]|jgi:DNA-binding response OmpR family regulator|uniref:response regulator n=1 Tax=Sphingomonas sp. TaxID=28214 RepID=UPI002E361F19|nr:response regulator [Sphingomonas sp.]HEX4694216.1 response regulator [Sphingomonas sp.]